MGNHFPHILGIIWISASPEIFKKPIKLKCFWFSCTMEIHICLIFGTAWIFASSRKFKKPLTLKCLCFPIFSPYYGNSLFFFHILGLVWINASHEICIRNSFGIFVFSHTFPLLCEFSFSILSELYGFLYHAK